MHTLFFNEILLFAELFRKIYYYISVKRIKKNTSDKNDDY